MAGSKSNTIENAILDHRYGGPDYARPATVYMAAFTVAPTDAGGGTECTGGAYARTPITNNSTNFPAASGGVKTNGTTFAFIEATGSWGGNVVAVAFFTASSGGTMLDWCDITSTPVAAGTTLRFDPGDLTLTED